MAPVESSVSGERFDSEDSRSCQIICHPLPSPDSCVGTSTVPLQASKVLQPTRRLDHTFEFRLQNPSDLPSARAWMPEASHLMRPRSAAGDCGTALPAPVLLSQISPKRLMDRPENLDANDQIHSSATIALLATDISKPVHEITLPETKFDLIQSLPTLETSCSLPAVPSVHVSHLRARHLQTLPAWSLPPASVPDNAHSQQHMEGTESVRQTEPFTLEESCSQRSDRSTSSARSALQKLQTSACLGFSSRSPEHLLGRLSSRNGSAVGEKNGTGPPMATSTNGGLYSAPANSIDGPSSWLSRLLRFEGLGIRDSSKVRKEHSGSPPVKKYLRKQVSTGSATVDTMNKVNGRFIMKETGRLSSEGGGVKSLDLKLDAAYPGTTKLFDDNLEATQGKKRKDGKRKSEKMRSYRWLLKLRWRLKGSKDDESVGSALGQKVASGTTPDHEHELENPLSGAFFDGSARLNSTEKVSSTKRGAKHKRSMSWASGNISTPFTPNQPRLAMRDAQELLMPPKRLSVAASEPADSQEAQKGTKLSIINIQTQVAITSGLSVSAKENDLAQEPCEPLPAADVEVEAPPAFSGKTGDCLEFSAVSHSSQCAPSQGDFQESKNLKPALSCEQPVKSCMSATTSTEVSQQEHLVQTRGKNFIPNAESLAATGEIDVNGTCSSVQKDNVREEGDILATQVEDVIVKHTVCEEAPSGNTVSTVSNASIGVSDSDHYNLQGPTQAQSEYSRLTESMNGANSLTPISFEDIIAGGSASATANILLKFFFKCREVEDLNKFLRLQKKRLLNASKSEFDECFHLILSTTNSGVSSMVASILTAWLLENTLAPATTAKWHAIPVINIPQHQMWQHRDAAWLLHVCGVDPSAILFVDEITPYELAVVAGRVKRAVIGQDVLITSNEVGSCCTLLGEKFRDECASLLQVRYMKTLLLAGILLDTENLSVGSSRDKEMATSLLVGAGSLGRNGFFNQLKQVLDDKYVTTFIDEIYGEVAPLG